MATSLTSATSISISISTPPPATPSRNKTQTGVNSNQKLWIIAPIVIGTIIFIAISFQLATCLKRYRKDRRRNNNDYLSPAAEVETGRSVTPPLTPSQPENFSAPEVFPSPEPSSRPEVYSPTRGQFMRSWSFEDERHNSPTGEAMLHDCVELESEGNNVQGSPRIPLSVELPGDVFDPPFWATEPLTPPAELSG